MQKSGESPSTDSCGNSNLDFKFCADFADYDEEAGPDMRMAVGEMNLRGGRS
jgi:hypothetical protein